MRFKLIESKVDKERLASHTTPELADKFFNIKHDIHGKDKEDGKNDVNYWLKRSAEELEDFINKFEYRKEKKDGLIYQDSTWTIYKITSCNMLNNLVGRHKLWCIQNEKAGIGADWDTHVNKKGTQYYLYKNNNTNKLYIKGINPNDEFENVVVDERNMTIHDKEFLNSMPKVE